MSRIIAKAAIRGAHRMVERAEDALAKAIEAKGKDAEVAYPNTAYYLPIMYLFLGQKVEKLGDLEESLQEARKLLRKVPNDELWLPYLGDTLDCGVATLIAEEAIEALKFVTGPTPVEGIWLSFTDDGILRTQGIKLVDGRMPGFAAVVGCTATNEQAVQLVRGMQERSILVFMAGHTNGRAVAEQLAEADIEMNWDTFLVPYGKEITAAVHALNFAARSAMTFGGIVPKGLKEAREILLYNRNRVYAFVLAIGGDDDVPEDQVITDEKYATAAGAINFGFPVISDVNIPEILPTGICTYEHVVANVTMEEIVTRAVEVRGLTIKIEKIPIPVPFGAGFEGERVRKEDMYVQFGGKYSDGFEVLRMKSMDEVADTRIEVIGPEIDEMTEGEAYPLGVVVEVAGRNFQEDFESVVERRIHEYISCANGIFHMGQRAITWVRISREAHKKGFKVKDFGEILLAKIHNDFSAIIDRVQVKLYTDAEKIKGSLEESRVIYRQRDDRIGGMTDEDVEDYYSCTLCQSYAPDHVCIVTPQRLGLCGAYTWLDCKASHQINEHGPNEPVSKGKCVDPVLGQWEHINEYISVKSNGNLTKFSAYSMLVDPMTSCGCFECIVGIMPEANGVIIVDRDHQGMTPIGMKFSTLAGQIGGGIQTPGFVGIGKVYITSPKFISAEGGIERVVWMPKVLKEEITERLKARLEDIGKPELLDKIATEEDAEDPEKLVEFLQKAEHPALAMAAMI
ncbi:MAG: acetyl-CoA decarbonylase/synthase complex subunit alpha/beta [Phycisphaerae bacterium]|nr:acetyl-CoA decarbonylase/synthase complex subunit alpha/beta [Phycisphaerae bacterium]MDP7637233.1 acetyl-CoA decarbonylase/synthase complex subunit alpha/beta [Phycisphaerae bacterium]